MKTPVVKQISAGKADYGILSHFILVDSSTMADEGLMSIV